jgi:carboxyl-terminal processing protease
MSKDDAEKLLKGADNAQIRITSVQDGVQVENTYTLHSPPDDANAANVDVIFNNIGYIKLPSFMDVKGFNALVNKLVEKNLKTPGGLQGLILDLRYNGGGLVPMAKALIRALVERGVILNERSRDNGFVVDSKTSIPPLSPIELAKLPAQVVPTLELLKQLPMVVLINGSSASASEIVTGTLQEVRPNTTVVGERSFGKGVEMAVRPMPTCGELAVTAKGYTTPSGKWLHNVGITPDVVVHQPRGSTEDAQLGYAVKLLQDKTRTNGANVATLPPGDKTILGTPAPRPLEEVKVVTWQDRVLQYRSEITRGAVGLLLAGILGGFVWLTRRRKR